MKRIVILLGVSSLAACSSTSSPSLGGPPQPASSEQRKYNGSASVGDFLTIAVDPASGVITYKDVSNGEAGSVPYTARPDGTYALADPTHNLTAAYEIPGYGLILEANKTGLTRDTPALVTAVESGPISLATLEGHAYNYMQFRTQAGGVELGSVQFQGSTGHVSTYWPYGATTESEAPFLANSLPLAGVTPDPSGTYFRADGDRTGTYDYIFGTANGIFIADTPNGSVLAFEKTATKEFDPSYAGTYKGSRYWKTGAHTGPGSVEIGTPNLGEVTLLLASDGSLTMSDASGTTLEHGTLTPVADTPYIYGTAGELQDPCFGLFTYRSTTATSRKDSFVTFVGRAMLFSSFTSPLPSAPTYDYQYGVALKTTT